MSSWHWDTASLEELVTTDILAAVVSAASPLIAGIGLVISAIAVLVAVIPLAIVSVVLELLTTSDSVVVEVFQIVTVGPLIIVLYLFVAWVTYLSLFEPASGDETAGVLQAGCRVGENAQALIWWLLIPLVSLCLVAASFWSNSAILDTKAPILMLFVFSGLVVMMRLRGMYYKIHGTDSIALSMVACYFLVAGAFEATSYIIGDGSIMTETLFDSEPGDGLRRGQLGMATLYTPLLMISDLLDTIGFTGTAEKIGSFGQLLLFNVNTGENFLLSLLLAVVVLPASLYSVGLIYSARSLIWNSLTWISASVVRLLAWVRDSVRVIIQIGTSVIAYTLFLRPRQ